MVLNKVVYVKATLRKWAAINPTIPHTRARLTQGQLTELFDRGPPLYYPTMGLPVRTYFLAPNLSSPIPRYITRVENLPVDPRRAPRYTPTRPTPTRRRNTPRYAPTHPLYNPLG